MKVGTMPAADEKPALPAESQPFTGWRILDDREAPLMEIRDQIVKQIDKMTPEMQQQVLRFVASLAASRFAGRERGGVASVL